MFVQLFYTGRLQSVPDGNWIDQVHLEWFWDYDHLEAHHGYLPPTLPPHPRSPVCHVASFSVLCRTYAARTPCGACA